MTGACTSNVVTVCRFQPIGHFLSITILTEVQSAQNQSQNAFEVASPLAAGREAFSLLVRLGSRPHISSCMCWQHKSDLSIDTCRPCGVFAMPPLVCGRRSQGAASTEKVHADKVTSW